MDMSDRTWQGTDRCYSLLETHSYTHKRFVSASLGFCAGQQQFMKSGNNWNPYPALFPLRIPHPNPIKTWTPASTRHCNPRVPPLFSAQISNFTANKTLIPHPTKPIGDPHLELFKKVKRTGIYLQLFWYQFPSTKLKLLNFITDFV